MRRKGRVILRQAIFWLGLLVWLTPNVWAQDLLPPEEIRIDFQSKRQAASRERQTVLADLRKWLKDPAPIAASQTKQDELFNLLASDEELSREVLSLLYTQYMPRRRRRNTPPPTQEELAPIVPAKLALLLPQIPFRKDWGWKSFFSSVYLGLPADIKKVVDGFIIERTRRPEHAAFFLAHAVETQGFQFKLDHLLPLAQQVRVDGQHIQPLVEVVVERLRKDQRDLLIDLATAINAVGNLASPSDSQLERQQFAAMVFQNVSTHWYNYLGMDPFLELVTKAVKGQANDLPVEVRQVVDHAPERLVRRVVAEASDSEVLRYLQNTRTNYPNLNVAIVRVRLAPELVAILDAFLIPDQPPTNPREGMGTTPTLQMREQAAAVLSQPHWRELSMAAYEKLMADSLFPQGRNREARYNEFFRGAIAIPLFKTYPEEFFPTLASSLERWHTSVAGAEATFGLRFLADHIDELDAGWVERAAAFYRDVLTANDNGEYVYTTDARQRALVGLTIFSSGKRNYLAEAKEHITDIYDLFTELMESWPWPSSLRYRPTPRILATLLPTLRPEIDPWLRAQARIADPDGTPTYAVDSMNLIGLNDDIDTLLRSELDKNLRGQSRTASEGVPNGPDGTPLPIIKITQDNAQTIAEKMLCAIFDQPLRTSWPKTTVGAGNFGGINGEANRGQLGPLFEVLSSTFAYGLLALKAEPYCDQLQGFTQMVVDDFSQVVSGTEKEFDTEQSAWQKSLWQTVKDGLSKVNGPVFLTSTGKFAALPYARSYAIWLLLEMRNHLQALPSSPANRAKLDWIQDSVNAIRRVVISDVSDFSRIYDDIAVMARGWGGGSYATLLGSSYAWLALNELPEASEKRMTDIARAAHSIDPTDLCHLPYGTRIGDNHEPPLASAARCPGFYLTAHYFDLDLPQTESGFKHGLRNWFKYRDDLILARKRNVGHSGPYRLAWYYLFPSIPLVATAMAFSLESDASKIVRYAYFIVETLSHFIGVYGTVENPQFAPNEKLNTHEAAKAGFGLLPIVAFGGDDETGRFGLVNAP